MYEYNTSTFVRYIIEFSMLLELLLGYIIWQISWGLDELLDSAVVSWHTSTKDETLFSDVTRNPPITKTTKEQLSYFIGVTDVVTTFYTQYKFLSNMDATSKSGHDSQEIH